MKNSENVIKYNEVPKCQRAHWLKHYKYDTHDRNPALDNKIKLFKLKLSYLT